MVQPIEDPERAIRLARTIASDISLYNEAKVVQGIESDSLFELLAPQLEEGRDLYRGRVSPDLYDRTNFFDQAIVDILIRSKASVASKIW